MIPKVLIDNLWSGGKEAFKNTHPMFYFVYALLLTGVILLSIVIYSLQGSYNALLEKNTVLYESKIEMAVNTTKALGDSISAVSKVSSEMSNAITQNSENIGRIQKELTDIKNSLYTLSVRIETHLERTGGLEHKKTP